MADIEKVNGWVLMQHPAFQVPVSLLIKRVQKLEKKDPQEYKKKKETKLLAAILKLTQQDIPADPANAVYRQGDTMGEGNRHWRRAKFFQQYRLFFRYNEKAKVIIYAWVNDDNTKRAYGSKNDAYRVFEKMLKTGNPPGSWEDLIKSSMPFERL